MKQGDLEKIFHGELQDAQTDKGLKKVLHFKKEVLEKHQNLSKFIINQFTLLLNLSHSEIIKIEQLNPNDLTLYFANYEETLQKYIYKKGNLKVQESLNFLTQLVNITTFLHKEQYSIGSILPELVFLTNNKQTIKVLELGIQKVNANQRITNLLINEIPFNLAPEYFVQNLQFSIEKADVWTLGCLFFYMLIGSDIFTQQKSGEYLQQIEEFWIEKEEFNLKQRLVQQKDQLKQIDYDTQQLLIKMLHYNPNKRISLSQTLEKLLEIQAKSSIDKFMYAYIIGERVVIDKLEKGCNKNYISANSDSSLLKLISPNTKKQIKILAPQEILQLDYFDLEIKFQNFHQGNFKEIEKCIDWDLEGIVMISQVFSYDEEITFQYFLISLQIMYLEALHEKIKSERCLYAVDIIQWSQYLSSEGNKKLQNILEIQISQKKDQKERKFDQNNYQQQIKNKEIEKLDPKNQIICILNKIIASRKNNNFLKERNQAALLIRLICVRYLDIIFAKDRFKQNWGAFISHSKIQIDQFTPFQIENILQKETLPILVNQITCFESQILI